MKIILIVLLMAMFNCTFCQNEKDFQPIANVRLSFLILPFTPLLTVEVRTFGSLTLQLESNFVNTHGANLKYFIDDEMNGHYVFGGLALVQNKLLRDDKKITYLPYVGYGYAYLFGEKRRWTFDNRIGLGATTNADNNLVFPIVKTGIGRLF
jgi:hypothetical protein